MLDLDRKRREQLGQFLRAKREALAPTIVRRRRRAKGLLREEVADSAGVSVTWYTWLEQARPTRPSQRTLEGLVAALGLTPAERTHLYRLARPDLDVAAPRESAAGLPPALAATLAGLAPHAAYATNARWDVLAWNAPAERLFGDFATHKNLLHRLLLDPAWQALFVGWEELARAAIAQFRATAVPSGDADELVALLRERSPLFAEVWHGHAVAQPMPRQKTLAHPDAGTLVFDYSTLRAEAPDDVRFAIYTPADAATTQRLHALR